MRAQLHADDASNRGVEDGLHFPGVEGHAVTEFGMPNLALQRNHLDPVFTGSRSHELPGPSRCRPQQTEVAIDSAAGAIAALGLPDRDDGDVGGRSHSHESPRDLSPQLDTGVAQVAPRRRRCRLEQPIEIEDRQRSLWRGRLPPVLKGGDEGVDLLVVLHECLAGVDAEAMQPLAPFVPSTLWIHARRKAESERQAIERRVQRPGHLRRETLQRRLELVGVRDQGVVDGEHAPDGNVVLPSLEAAGFVYVEPPLCHQGPPHRPGHLVLGPRC